MYACVVEPALMCLSFYHQLPPPKPNYSCFNCCQLCHAATLVLCLLLLCYYNRVTIGSRVLFGPNVQVYAATHPLDGHVRQGMRGPELAKPISIGDDVWVGGGAIICPGVTIGDNAVVGAGSVVTRDVEAYTVVAGNPAKVIRRLERPAANGEDAGETSQQQQQQQQGAATLPN